MVHSTWGDWFIDNEVEGSRPEGVAVWYLGCNGFVLRSSSTTLFVDPYLGDGFPPYVFRMIPVPFAPEDVTECDGVFVSHEHVDHMHPPSFAPMLGDGAVVHGTEPCFEDPEYDGPPVPEADRSLVEAGDELRLGDFTVHVRASNDPYAEGAVTYVFEHDAGTFFHAGDSMPSADFEQVGAEFDIDVGAFAFGSRGNIYFPDDDAVREVDWYMDGTQVVQIANQLGVDRLLPVHYDMWKGLDGDPKEIHEAGTSHAYPKVVEPVKVGDRIDLGEPGIVPMQVVSD